MKGDGVALDPKRAATLFEKACAAPFSPSCVALAEMYKTGTGVPKNLAKSRRLYLRACKVSGGAQCYR